MSSWTCQINFRRMIQSVERPPAYTLIGINLQMNQRNLKMIVKSAKASRNNEFKVPSFGHHHKEHRVQLFLLSRWCKQQLQLWHQHQDVWKAALQPMLWLMERVHFVVLGSVIVPPLKDNSQLAVFTEDRKE